MRHSWVVHESCDRPGACPICDGGLAVCRVCNLAEGSLTTDCPGVESYGEYGERVYAGELDYREGHGWVEVASSHSPEGMKQMAGAPGRVLSIDIETYSSVDLAKAGVYAYTEAPDFEILLLAYAWDDGPVHVVDLAQGEEIPRPVLYALVSPEVIKTAWNAQFERTALERHLLLPMRPEEWRCSMVHSYYLGLPGSLGVAARAVGVEVQKDTAGTALIRYFSKPCKPTKSNGQRTRNLPEHDPERWAQFIEYCRQDVVVERAVRTRLERFPLPENEQRLWELDQQINDRGVLVDRILVTHAVACDAAYSQRLTAEAAQLTGLDNPNSVAQLRRWVEEADDRDVTSLNKVAVAEILDETENDDVRQVLELRQEMAKASVAKYQAIQRAVCQDGRVRGLLQFYGASRTGRWAGRLMQVQNLPRNTMPDLDLARRLLRDGDYEALELLFDSVPVALSQLLRTALIPTLNHEFAVCDFSAIEARVIAWLAGEEWVLNVFRGDGRIYEATAAQMFGVPVESITRGSDLRQKGKVATLACGYQGGPNALVAMGALQEGLTEDELPGLVQAWRLANPHIVQFWYDVGDAALTAVRERTTVPLQHGLAFIYGSGMLRIQLPSGRHLYYVRPRIEVDPVYNRPGLTYEGQEQGRWGRLRTYGGRLAENITQAVARDCLAEALLRLDAANYPIAFHVHDEVVAEVPVGLGLSTEMAEIMSQPIAWAPGLPLRAEGFECQYYQKD